MKIKKGDYLKVPFVKSVAKILSDKLDHNERQILIVDDSSFEVCFEDETYLEGSTPITKEEFDAAFEKTMKFLEGVK